MKDSRGNRSKTLPFVVIAFGAVTVKFLVAGATLGGLGAMPEMDAMSYGAAVALILGIWLGREATEKVFKRVQ